MEDLDELVASFVATAKTIDLQDDELADISKGDVKMTVKPTVTAMFQQIPLSFGRSANHFDTTVSTGLVFIEKAS